MRLLLIIAGLALAGGIQSAAAQGTRVNPPLPGQPQERIALSAKPETRPRSMQLACAPLLGIVFEPNGNRIVFVEVCV